MKTFPVQVFTCAILVLLCGLASNSEAQNVPKNVPTNVKQLQKPRSSPQASPSLRDTSPYSMNRFFEFRAGPRFSMIDGNIRPGGDGSSSLNLQDDLKLDEVTVGPQFDFEMRVGEKWVVTVNYALSNFEGEAISNRVLTYHAGTNPPINPNTQQTPSLFPAGSRIASEVEIHTVGARIAWEVIKTDRVIFAPLIGLKAIFLEETVQLNNINTGGTTRDKTNIEEVTPLVGFETKLRVNKNLHLGIAPYGFGWENYGYFGGQGWVGVDVDERFGIRLGIDVDYISAAREAGSPYATTTTLAGAFLQGVVGF